MLIIADILCATEIQSNTHRRNPQLHLMNPQLHLMNPQLHLIHTATKCATSLTLACLWTKNAYEASKECLRSCQKTHGDAQGVDSTYDTAFQPSTVGYFGFSGL